MADDTVKLPVRLKDGTLLTDELLEQLVAEAEAGYDPATLVPTPVRAGRPSLGREGVSPRVQFRASPEVYAAAQARATKEGRTVSAVLRDLLAEYARGNKAS